MVDVGTNVGTHVPPARVGFCAFGATDDLPNRTSPCCAVPLTVGNSPPSTTYSSLAATLHAACSCPVNVPGISEGSQWTIDGLGFPNQSFG